MESINRIEIQGAIGAFRITDIQGNTMVRCTVATNHIDKGSDGYAIIENTWHDITYFKRKDDNLDLDRLGKGVRINVIGRIKNVRYTAADGSERNATQVIGSDFKILEA